MQIERLDHLVLTVADISRTCEFYTRMLGMEVVHFGEGRTALRFGRQKINCIRPATSRVSSPTSRPRAQAICASSLRCLSPKLQRISNIAGCRSWQDQGRGRAQSARSSRFMFATRTRT
jgi:hypothetical protein